MRAEDVLPEQINQGEFNGVTVRKGTVAAFLINARVWVDPAASGAQHACAERDMLETLASLRALGLFEVLQVRDERLRAWLAAH